MKLIARDAATFWKTFTAFSLGCHNWWRVAAVVCLFWIAASCGRQQGKALQDSKGSKSEPNRPESISQIPNAEKGPAATIEKAPPDKFADLARRDLGIALGEAKALVSPDDRARALAAIARVAFERNLDALPELLAAASSPDEMHAVISNAGGSWADRDYKYLYDFAQSKVTGDARNALQAEAVNAAANGKNFDDARKMVAAMNFSSDRTGALKELAQRWVRSTPAEALEWVNSLALPEDQRAAYSTIGFIALNKRDVDTLNTILQNSSDPSVRSETVNYATRVLLAQQSADATLNWIDALPASEKDAAVDTYVRAGDVSNVPKMVSEVEEIADKGKKWSLAYALLGRLTEIDPKGASIQVMTLPDDIRAWGLRGVVANWYSADSSAASSWINSLRPGPDRDAGLSQIATLLKDANPDAARQTAMSIQDPMLQKFALQQIGTTH